MLNWGSSSVTSSSLSADKKSQLAMVPQGMSSVLDAIIPYRLHAICGPPKAAGLTPSVCPICTAFMPPDWGIGSWVLRRKCFTIFFYRKLQQNKIISPCISPMSNHLNQGQCTIWHPVYASHLMQELLQLCTPGTWCILQVFTVTLSHPQPSYWVMRFYVLWKNFEMVFHKLCCSKVQSGEGVKCACEVHSWAVDKDTETLFVKLSNGWL